MSTVYTGGTFDLFHAGHVNLLRECHALAGPGGRVIVSLNTDEFITQYKGVPPICNFDERKVVLESCIYVDEVIENSGGPDSKPAILHAAPDFIAIGSDWQDKDYFSQMQFTQDWLKLNNISLIYVPYTLGISSSAIKKRII